MAPNAGRDECPPSPWLPLTRTYISTSVHLCPASLYYAKRLLSSYPSNVKLQCSSLVSYLHDNSPPLSYMKKSKSWEWMEGGKGLERGRARLYGGAGREEWRTSCSPEQAGLPS